MVGRVVLEEEEQMFITRQVVILDMKGKRLIYKYFVRLICINTIINNIFTGFSLAHFSQIVSLGSKLTSISEVETSLFNSWL